MAMRVLLWALTWEFDYGSQVIIFVCQTCKCGSGTNLTVQTLINRNGFWGYMGLLVNCVFFLILWVLARPPFFLN